MMKKHFIQALNQSSKEQFAFTCNDFDLIIAVGTLPSRHNKTVLESIQTSVASGAKLVYLFTMEDPSLTKQSTFFSRYEVGSEEGVFALLAQSFLLHVKTSRDIEMYFKELDEGYVSAESNIGEEEIEEIEALYNDAKNVLLILGDDLRMHPQAKNIAHLAGLIATHGKAKLWVAGSTAEDIMLSDEEYTLEEVASIKSYDGAIVYQCPIAVAEEKSLLIGSAQFQMAAKVNHNDSITIAIHDEVYPRTFVCDDSLKGVIALMPCTKADDTYPYYVAKIVKADVHE